MPTLNEEDENSDSDNGLLSTLFQRSFTTIICLSLRLGR